MSTPSKYNPFSWLASKFRRPLERKVGFNAFSSPDARPHDMSIDGSELPPVNGYSSDGEGFRPITNRDEHGRVTGFDKARLMESLRHLAEAAPTLPGLSMYLDANGFRSLNQSLLDFTGDVRLNILRRARWLNATNPLASRGMQIRTDMVVSEGFKIEPTTPNPQWRQRIQEVIDDHWQYNQWDRLNQRERDLGVAGERIRRVPPLAEKIGDSPGQFLLSRFRCGMILPELVETVSLDPWDYERPIAVHLLQGMFPANSNLHLKICSDTSEIEGINNINIQGDAFYTAVNRVGGQSRGISDLTPTIEWIDAHDQSLFNDVERAQMMMRFIWDVTLTGADPQVIDEYAKRLKQKPPRNNSWRVHDENEKVEAISPDLKIQETADLRENLFLVSWGSMGLPRHWFVEAENVNKASSEEMVTPVFAWARNRRMQTKSDLLMEFRMAIQVAAQTPRLADIPREELGIRIISRDPDRSKYEALATSSQGLAQGLAAGIQSGLIDQLAAAKVFCEYLSSFGIEVTTEAGGMVEDREIPGERNQAQADLTANLTAGSPKPAPVPAQGELGSAAQDARVKAGMPPTPPRPSNQGQFDKVIREAQDKLNRARMRADLREKMDNDSQDFSRLWTPGGR